MYNSSLIGLTSGRRPTNEVNDEGEGEEEAEYVTHNKITAEPQPQSQQQQSHQQQQSASAEESHDEIEDEGAQSEYSKRSSRVRSRSNSEDYNTDVRHNIIGETRAQNHSESDPNSGINEDNGKIMIRLDVYHFCS